MTDKTHPITPPPELVREWNEAAIGTHFPPYGYSEYIATQAARWGADQELEACCGLIGSAYVRDQVRAARRPNAPSLKEQALEVLENVATYELMGCAKSDNRLSEKDAAVIRRALELLDD